MRSAIMRRWAAVAVIVAALTSVPGAALARGGRWCAESNAGWWTIRDCSYMTLQQCIPYVIAGNRGFCNLNPDYTGPPAARHKAHRKHHIKQP
jgi:Protein of unknown function (DUF3551)